MASASAAPYSTIRALEIFSASVAPRRCLRRVAVECFPQRLGYLDGCRPFLSAPLARKVRRELPLLPRLSQAAGVRQDKTLRHGKQVRGCGVFPSYARRLFHFGLVPFHKGEIEPCDQSVVEYGIALEGLPENCFRFGRPAKELMSCCKIHIAEGDIRIDGNRSLGLLDRLFIFAEGRVTMPEEPGGS